MKRSRLALVPAGHGPLLAAVLSLSSTACLSSSSTPASTSPTVDAGAGAFGPDAGAGCVTSILVRCLYPSGICAEYSGLTTSDAGDLLDCEQSGGVLAHEACVRTGTEGACVIGAGFTGQNGKACEAFLSTWLPAGYDSGTPGQACAGQLGTFVPN